MVAERISDTLLLGFDPPCDDAIRKYMTKPAKPRERSAMRLLREYIDEYYPVAHPYQGRLASLWHDVAGLTPVGREGTVAAQAVEFEAARDYLLGRWETYLPWIDSGESR